MKNFKTTTAPGLFDIEFRQQWLLAKGNSCSRIFAEEFGAFYDGQVGSKVMGFFQGDGQTMVVAGLHGLLWPVS